MKIFDDRFQSQHSYQCPQGIAVSHEKETLVYLQRFFLYYQLWRLCRGLYNRTAEIADMLLPVI